MQRVYLSWSSGKDSAWALERLRQTPGIEVLGLVTTVNRTHGRVAMHAVREQLLELQAAAVGLPLEVIDLPWPCPDGTYEELMASFVERATGAGATHMAFGDLFLEDIRKYREERLAGTGLEPLFPLWGIDTSALARDMTRPLAEGGLETWLTCVDPAQVPAELAGRRYDRELVAELEALGADPCGENGEFHSFVVDGPGFAHRIDVQLGEVVTRDSFVFADLLPA